MAVLQRGTTPAVCGWGPLAILTTLGPPGFNSVEARPRPPKVSGPGLVALFGLGLVTLYSWG